MNRIITIHVASPNVDKASRGTASQHGIINVFAPLYALATLDDTTLIGSLLFVLASLNVAKASRGTALQSGMFDVFAPLYALATLDDAT
jgi:hypothetical protein